MRNFLFYFLALLTLFGCSGEVTESDYSGELVKLKLSGSIQGLVETKASPNFGFQLGDTIKIHVSQSGDFSYVEEYWGVPDGNGGIRLSEDIYFPTTGNPLSIIAFYPHNIMTRNGDGFIGDCYQYHKYDTSTINDLLTAKVFNIYKTSETVNLEFHHALSMVEFNITNGHQYVDSLLLPMVNTGFKYNHEGVLSLVNNTPNTLVADTYNRNSAAMIIPAQALDSLGLVTGDGLVRTDLGINTEPGKITTINLSVSLTGVELTTYIKPWDKGITHNKDINL